MRVGIIGAGNVGKTLGRGWLRAGHEVAFGVRNPADPKYGPLSEEGALIEHVAEIGSDAEVVVLATPWSATREAIDAAGGLSGKILIDCTNPLEPDLSGLTLGHDDSGGEQVARWAPGAHVVKAFNTIGFNIMEDPLLEKRKAALFICGDERGKALARELSDALGFETVDAGGIESARMLEPFALLWISSAYRFGLGRDFTFSIVRR